MLMKRKFIAIGVVASCLVGIVLFFNLHSTDPPTIDTAIVNNITKNPTLSGSYTNKPQIKSLKLSQRRLSRLNQKKYLFLRNRLMRLR